MMVLDVCNRVARIQITNAATGQWSWGSGFWATDGKKTALVTASHLWRDIGGRGVSSVTLEYELPGQANVCIQNVSVQFSGGDMVRLDVAPPSTIVPFPISTSLPTQRALVLAVGYGGSLNQPSGPMQMFAAIHVMLVCGRIEAHHKRPGVELLEIRTMAEQGFSGGPLFIANDSSGNVASNVLNLDERHLSSVEVVALCSGSLQLNPDHVGFETMHSF
jgi:hypothetical protein